MDEQEKFDTNEETEAESAAEQAEGDIAESTDSAAEAVNEAAEAADPFIKTGEAAAEAEAEAAKPYSTEPVSGWNNAFTQQQGGAYNPSGSSYNPQNSAYRSGYDASNESGYSPYSAGSYAYRAPEEPAQKKNDGKKLGKIILCVAIALIVAFCGIFGALIAKRGSKASSESSKEGDAQLEIKDSAVADIDESDGLSPQEIYTKNIQSNVGIILYGSSNSLFSQSSGTTVAGEGSGIVMGTDKGKTKTYIITCAHVIEAVKTKNYKAVVQDYNGEQYDAEVVGYDSKTDIGVIAVKETGFTAATFGDSSKLKIGETVYAIGNPGGTEFFGSYTKGMISAIDRPVSNEIGYDMKCIQHDAAINPGNSGGMLINSAGQIVGINSSKIASTEYEGMGFAIPISSAKTIIDDIIANGYVTNRPKLGIKYTSVSQNQFYAMIAHYNNLPSGSLIIAEIGTERAFKGTDAQKGDLIIAVNGEPMESADVLLDKIENGKVGDKLKLTLCRIDESKNYDVKKFDVEVTLIEDRGDTTTEEQQTQSYEDYFNQFFGGY